VSSIPSAVLAQAVEIPGELSSQARVLVAVLGLGAMGLILVLLRRRQLRSKYALLWLSLGIALGALGLFPGLLTGISRQVGVFYPPALFLLVACGVLFLVVIQFSWELSRLEERTRTLAEELALLRADLERRDKATQNPSDPSGSTEH
jgi:hypothetical protein